MQPASLCGMSSIFLKVCSNIRLISSSFTCMFFRPAHRRTKVAVHHWFAAAACAGRTKSKYPGCPIDAKKLTSPSTRSTVAIVPRDWPAVRSARID